LIGLGTKAIYFVRDLLLRLLSLLVMPFPTYLSRFLAKAGITSSPLMFLARFAAAARGPAAQGVDLLVR
jgi:hypothetical protein